jgi:hypothetical protein
MSMHKMFGIFAFLDYGLPSLIKLKNVIRVRYNFLYPLVITIELRFYGSDPRISSPL